MFVSPMLVATAKSWGESKLAQSARPREALTRPDEVIDLLAESTSPGAQASARELLRQMSNGTWFVLRGAHTSKSDAMNHVLIEVKRVRWHLRLDLNWCVSDITRVVEEEVFRPSGRPPGWVGPGA